MQTPYRHGTTARLASKPALVGLASLLLALAPGRCVCPLAAAQNAQGRPEAIQRMATDADPSFEVATVKLSDPDERGTSLHTEGRRLDIKNQTIHNLLAFAYGVHSKQIVDEPGWLATDRYDIDGIIDTEGQPNLRQLQGIIKKLLADRFQLKMHRESRELAVYALTVAKDGPRIAKSKGDPNVLGDENDQNHNGVVTQSITNMSMTDFTLIMQYFTDRPIVDQTDLTGKWDFKWTWTSDDSRLPADAVNPPPGLFTAIQEQLGLKLEAKKAPADVYVIDHVERPGAN
jgi:uncharacterized protein (TIGR03435 family)